MKTPLVFEKMYEDLLARNCVAVSCSEVTAFPNEESGARELPRSYDRRLSPKMTADLSMALHASGDIWENECAEEAAFDCEDEADSLSLIYINEPKGILLACLEPVCNSVAPVNGFAAAVEDTDGCHRPATGCARTLSGQEAKPAQATGELSTLVEESRG